VTDRSDALRKVQGLMALAAPTSGASDEEKAAAERKAIALRLKHGISDHMLELAQASADMDGTEFFGHLLFFYGQHLAAHVEAIRAEIAAALTKVDKLDPLNRAEMYCKLYRELRDTVEGATWASSDIGLKPKRDAAVKALYQQIAYEYAASRDHSDRDSFGFERMQHEWARDRTASACDLRKDVVERIVGVSEKSIWRKELRSYVCERCGLDGNEKRETCDLFDVDGERKWLHPACHTATEATDGAA
jgi:hypothetical protein